MYLRGVGMENGRAGDGGERAEEWNEKTVEPWLLGE